jgi:hypothetical protein
MATGVPVDAFADSAAEELAVQRLRKEWEHADGEGALVPLDTLARVGWRPDKPDEWLKLASNALLLRRVLGTALGVREADFVLRADLTAAVRGLARRVPPPPRLVAAGTLRFTEAYLFVPCSSVTESSVISLTAEGHFVVIIRGITPGEGFHISAKHFLPCDDKWGHGRRAGIAEATTVHWVVMEP